MDGSTAPRVEIWRGREVPTAPRVARDFHAIVRSEALPRILTDVGHASGIVVAALGGDELRGYATLVPSSALTRERWENLPDAFEFGSIEVARSQRGRGMGTALMATLDACLPLERLILFARGFVNHWDLAFADRPPILHRRTLLRMLARVGFQRWDTDDPEVNDHPLNFLAVRTGLQAPSESVLQLCERARGEARHPWW